MHAARSLLLPGSEDGLRAARAGLDAFWAAEGLPAGACWPFQVALDEVLSNIVRHGGGPAMPQIELTLKRADDCVEMLVVDDARAFNPLEADAPDISQPLAARAPGGLGVALVRRLMDVVEYERSAERNRLRMRRRLTPEPA